jgi:hypothetical protein
VSRPTSHRRDFLVGIAGGIAGLAVTSCAGSRQGGATSETLALAPARSGTTWDDSWTTRLGRLRTVFDVADLETEPGASAVPDVMDAYHEALGTTDRDLGIVLVLRHRAIPLFLGDAIWSKYDVARKMAEKDPATNAPYRVNPQRALIVKLQQRGVIVLGCNRAVSGFIARTATETKTAEADVRRDVMGSILPGVILQPNGLYALSRAQTAGCGVMR